MGKYVKRGRQLGPKVDIPDIAISMYLSGMSLPEVCVALAEKKISKSTLRSRLVECGLIRTRTEGIRLSAKNGKLGNPGTKREFSEQWKENISKSRRKWSEYRAKGKSLKPNGYLEITRGKNKGRGEHVVIMEEVIGRKIVSKECVHHINHERADNRIENLELMTRSDHSRLHAIEKLPTRKRRRNGQWDVA